MVDCLFVCVHEGVKFFLALFSAAAGHDAGRQYADEGVCKYMSVFAHLLEMCVYWSRAGYRSEESVSVCGTR